MNPTELVRAVHEAALRGGTLIDQVPDPPPTDPYVEEWRAFKREAYRLICEGHRGRFALIKGSQIISIWDTLRDAIQAGHERFGQEPLLIQEIQLYVRTFRSGYFRLCRNS
jgi:hypothetical protein